MCDHITVQISSDEGDVHVTAQGPSNVQPAALREMRDQAVGAFRDALRVLADEAKALEDGAETPRR